VRRAGKVLYAGTYERDYPRNYLVIQALRSAGYEVEELHVPVWERIRDKSRLGRDLLRGARLVLRLIGSYLWLLARLALRVRRYDAVIIGYPGQLDLLALGPLVKLARRALVFNPLVTLTDTVVEDRELVREGSLGARLIELVDRLALRLPDGVLVDTPYSGDYLVSRFGVDAERISTVNVGADETVFDPARDVHSRERGDEPKPFRVLFYGKLIPLHGVETILDAAELLAGEPDVHFEIIGSGQLGGLVRDRLRSLANGRVTYCPWVEYDELPRRIVGAGCVLGIFGSGEKAGRVVPNKVYQAMAMGAPIITRSSPAIELVLAHRQTALLVPPADAPALAAAIREIREPELRARLGHGAREAFLRTGSQEALARSLDVALGGSPDRAAVSAVTPTSTDGMS
jgi:glycosyltransferase involved in cell wall biosynthesis